MSQNMSQKPSPKTLSRHRLSHLLQLRPVPAGEVAPPLSLTAEEGTWIRTRDFEGHLNVVLVFFRSLLDDATDNYLVALERERPRFEALDTVIFGVNQNRTERLREYRNRHGLKFHLVYDPFAWTARKFGCAGRLRPYCKPSVVLVGRNGRVVDAWRGRIEVETLLARIAELEGTSVPEPDEEREFTGVRDPGAPADTARTITLAEAEELLSEEDSPFVLLDVRTPDEFASFRVPGSVNIPLDELPHRYQELEQTTHIICVSQTGGLSAAAAEFLTSIGASSIFTVEEGVAGWTGESSIER